ncbi:syntaxin-17-like [Mytilus trossulus]|uniref:syntaxin-17-like n=1 Tax=Mytilus trossulus TaxID=6551 RepID=UPI0030044307
MNITNMGSFEKNTSWTSRDTEIPKFPIQRLEPSIQKFLKVIEMDLDRLHKHRLNIEKYSRLQDWTNLNKEQINTTRTVQQIVSNIKEIEKTRRQVQDSDLHKFDEKIKDMKNTAIRSIKEFAEIESTEAETQPESQQHEHDDEEDANLSHPLMPGKHTDDPTRKASVELGIEQLQINPKIIEDTEAMESWENLHQNLMELNTMIHHFSTEVHSQQEKVDNIQDNLETAQQSINDGTRSLGGASKYKAAIFPIAGAVIGTIMAGPVGLVAGAKIGGVAGAIGGGALGFTGGRIIKSRQDKITNIELSNLSEKSTDCSHGSSEDKQSPGNSWLPWNW